MTEYLLFRLYGPLASWGRVAVGGVRGSDAHPSKSAVLGLVAAALGLRRDDAAAQAQLAAGYGFAVRVDVPGVLLRDYHTAQVPGRSALKRRPHATRRDELAVPKEDLNTILSVREYRCDGLYTIALWLDGEPPYALDALQSALERPRFPLYLGRKSCPPALPLDPRRVTAPSLADAFGRTAFRDDPWLRPGRDGRERLEWSAEPALFWEAGLADTAGLEPLLTAVRRDQPLSRRRWQFAERREVRGRLAPDDPEKEES